MPSLWNEAAFLKMPKNALPDVMHNQNGFKPVIRNVLSFICPPQTKSPNRVLIAPNQCNVAATWAR